MHFAQVRVCAKHAFAKQVMRDVAVMVSRWKNAITAQSGKRTRRAIPTSIAIRVLARTACASQIACVATGMPSKNVSNPAKVT
jgi:hypothetical protein